MSEIRDRREHARADAGDGVGQDDQLGRLDVDGLLERGAVTDAGRGSRKLAGGAARQQGADYLGRSPSSPSLMRVAAPARLARRSARRRARHRSDRSRLSPARRLHARRLGESPLAWMADKIVGLRLFADAEDKMNLALADVDGATARRLAVHALRRRGEGTPAELHRRGATRDGDPALRAIRRAAARARRARSRPASSAR